jgi:hypothetical protein
MILRRTPLLQMATAGNHERDRKPGSQPMTSLDLPEPQNSTRTAVWAARCQAEVADVWDQPWAPRHARR